MKLSYIFAIGIASLTWPAAAQITTMANGNATQLGAVLQGGGVTFTSASLTTDGAGTGTFTDGLSANGIDSGVVLTTGTLDCAGSVNTIGNCGVGDIVSFSTLTLGFTATSTSLFFNYVFASEEYNEFVNEGVNDTFRLTLTGPGYAGNNLAQVPGAGGVVSIDNVNSGSNAGFFRDNSLAAIPIQFDGLTTVFTASASNLVVGASYSLVFDVRDGGDTFYDSAVFIQGSSIGTTPPENAVPEPSTWATMIAGFAIIGGRIRRRRTRPAATRA